MPLIFNFEFYARVAKLVDALCSGRSVRKGVLVRIQSRALTKKPRKISRLFNKKLVLGRRRCSPLLHVINFAVFIYPPDFMKFSFLSFTIGMHIFFMAP